ncbi:hypothetical protein ACFV1W_08280 [Kitasatospora sp. NPDC059648]|uniref:hypothetical protein n=1 Tax=Kitasatospora sp. NPDC059648 TaxID=3346894 RepID=UPI0036A8E2BA
MGPVRGRAADCWRGCQWCTGAVERTVVFVVDGGTPSERIAAELRRRIAAGELKPGARVSSPRRIIRERGVAVATATKVWRPAGCPTDN